VKSVKPVDFSEGENVTEAENFLSQISQTRLVRLLEISRELNSTTGLNALLKKIINEAATLTNAEAASILLLDPYTRELRFKATSGEMPPELADTPVPLGSSIAGTILTTNKPLIVDDVSQDPRWNPQVSQTINFPTGSILGVPMHDVARPVGVLEALNKIEGQFSEEDVAILSILADLAGVAVEKARLFAELQQANQQLNELDRLKSDFIAVASHELRTPLSIILGYVSHLREVADADSVRQLDSVLRAAVRLRNLIQDMLNLQYVDAGRTSLERRPVDLSLAINNIVAERYEIFLSKQQLVETQIPTTPVPALVDRNMIQVIFSNLLDNASKFTPEQGKIIVSLTQHDHEIWVTIKDSGIGIAEEQLSRVFNRFYQIEPHLRRQHEGMGLGLAIAKELVALNKGRIWATSTVGEGSEFYVAFPIYEDQ
jgi:signal transduction histidine kinase